jgi:hypothetical protein
VPNDPVDRRLEADGSGEVRMVRLGRGFVIGMLLAVACGATRGEDAAPLPPADRSLAVDEPLENAVVPGAPLGEPPPEATVTEPPVVVEEPFLVEPYGPPDHASVGETPPFAPSVGCAAAGAGRPQAYAIADVLFLQRDNQSTDQLLAASAGQAVITTGQLQFATQPGLRLFVGAVNDSDAGWEVGYLGVWGMFASRTAGGTDNLQTPDPLALLVPEFNDRSLARATYASTLNSAEINVFSRADDGGFCRGAAEPWRRCAGYCRGTFDWLAGVRWAGLDEAADLTLTGGASPDPGLYSLRSSTNLFGAQLGGRGRMEWERWAFEGWAKVALCGSALSQSQDPIVDPVVPDPPIRPAQSAFEGGVGFIGDLNATLVYRLTETWGLRAGYNLIWLSGVALAPNQFDFGAQSTSGSGLNGGAGLYLHGASLGLEARW